MTVGGKASGHLPTTLTMLGLDLGLASTGYAVVQVDLDQRKIIRTLELDRITTERDNHAKIRRTSDDYLRARILHGAISAIVKRHKVCVVACEMVTTSPYARPSLNFGVMLGILASFDFYVVQVLPRQIKNAVTGNRDATKEEVIRWALELTRNDDVNWPTSARQNRLNLRYRARHVTIAAEHQADALAAIHCALQSEQLRESVALQRALVAV